MKNWIYQFQNKKTSSSIKNGIIISGPVGIGKTLTASLLLKDFKYTIKEINTTHERSRQALENVIGQILNQRNICSMLSIKPTSGTGIIIDEVDQMTNKDRNGLSYLIECIHPTSRNTKRKKYDKIPKIQNPFIFICRNENINKLKVLKKNVVSIKLNPLTQQEYINVITRILKLEKFTISNKCIELIIQNGQRDIRRMINILEEVHRKIKNCKTKIQENDLYKVILSFQKKHIVYNIYQVTESLLHSKHSMKQLMNLYDSDPGLLPLMIHENCVDTIWHQREGKKQKKLDMILSIYDNLSIANMFERYIYLNQSWIIQPYISLLSCFSVNHIVHKLPIKYSKKYIPIRFASFLSKRFVYHHNKKTMYNLCTQIKCNSVDFYNYCQTFLQLLLHDTIDKDEKIYIINQYSITFKQIEWMVNNSTYMSYWKKRWTIKVKKDIKKLCAN